jgi:hypothetical protein
VYGAKNTSKKSGIFGALLQFNHFLIEAREVFITFDQELTNSFLIFLTYVVHDLPLISRPRKIQATFCESMMAAASAAVLSALVLDTFK